uniref:Secreted protein n=2 Tax=Loa loa TaxID=7209 RepID=A0A1I7V7Z7_LOALO
MYMGLRVCMWTLRRQGTASFPYYPSGVGVAAAVVSACSSGSSSLATCFGHRFALDGIEKYSAMGWMETACRNTATE